MSKKQKVLIETKGTGFSDNLTCAGNTWLRMVLERNDILFNLNIIISSRLDTDSYTTTTLVGVSPEGIDNLIGQLILVRNELVKNIQKHSKNE